MPVTIGGSGPITGVTSINTSVTDTELGYLDGVTSALQTQLAGKADTTGNGAWTSYTPQVDQGATTNIAKSIGYAKYILLGKLCICNVHMTLSASGTAGSLVTVTLPFTSAVGSPVRIGMGHVYDNSTNTRYVGAAELNSLTQVNFVGSWSAGNGWGVNPNLAVASSDQIAFSVSFEVA